ncbi:hypothetical protein [Marispirochaeta sp.]|uniref:hypothetical protein n=1 Tax=Marispirochaeta sp. TaxID=2038653 RepID=UPI0029C8CCAC|nr:hypothetical protein [Marispirochaeta sp.]
MGKTTLLVSRRNPFPPALLDYFLDRGDYLFVASPTLEENADEIEGYRHLPWNPRSPISARNTVLTIENEAAAIDEAYLLYEHGEESRPLHQVPGTIIDISIDTALRGGLFICKEILNHYDTHSRGELTLLLAGYPSSVRPSLESAMEGAFRQMGSALFQVYGDSNIRIRGFEDHRESMEDFYREVTEILKTGDEKCWGKWNRPGERGGIFSYFSR